LQYIISKHIPVYMVDLYLNGNAYITKQLCCQSGFAACPYTVFLRREKVGIGYLPIRMDNLIGCPYNNTMKKENLFSKRKSPRLKEFDYSQPYIYFLTICTIEKKNIFQNDDLNREIKHCLLEEKTNSGIRLLCYCLMPNHIHLLAQPKRPRANISKFIAAFKRKTYTISQNYGIEGKIWQSSFYDHIVRKREALSEIMKYILNNPVRKKLVEKWDDFLYSGYVDNLE